jgi:hypothetical protein
VGWARAAEYRTHSPRADTWARHPDNDPVVVWEVEREHHRGAGVILRNLHGGARRAHLTLLEADVTEGPYFHNLHPALPGIWGTRVVVACEGPRDARVLHQAGVPAVAYLGQVPTEAWWRVLRRYAAAVVWVPDNDIHTDPRTRERRAEVPWRVTALGLGFRTLTLRGVKDPGELVDHPGELERLIVVTREMSRRHGGLPGLVGVSWEGSVSLGGRQG